MMVISFVVFSYLLFSCIVLLSVAEVYVLKSTQYIYDLSPKLRIRGAGFDAVDSHDINLELKASNQNPLQVGKDFMLVKDANGDGLILKLLGNRRWADLTGRVPPVALILYSVKFNNSDANLITEPVVVAQILNTPTIKENTNLILYQSASNELRINGTGFIGSKKVDFYFQPPIVKEVTYEDVTPYPLFNDQIILRLRHGYSWRKEAGKLLIIGVNTGGGTVKVNGDVGLQVADVQENLAQNTIIVEDTASKQFLYVDEPTLMISGSGFSTVGNSLRFANNIMHGVNYNIVMNSQNSLTLRLVQSYTWNVQNLPAPITLLAVNAGQGFVSVGPHMKGQDVAMIFERPAIFNGYHTLSKTSTRSFIIHGIGFPISTTNFKPSLKFEPALQENVDYTIRVIDRTTIEITLMENKEWRSEPGPLYVIGVNTRGDVKGWIDYTSNKVIVAQVVDDPPSNISGISGNNKEIELIKDNLLFYNQLHKLINNILLYTEKVESIQSKYDNTTQSGLTISDQKLIKYLQERIQETYLLSSMIKTQLKLPAN